MSKKLEQLLICGNREALLSKEMEKEFYNLEQGFRGENEQLEWFKKYGSEHWHYVSNYWFNHGKLMEADMLVISEQEWLVIEVKNYHGLFEYKDRECYINGRLMSDDQVAKMNHRLNRIRHIAAEVSSEIKVVGAMVFINEHSDVRLENGNEFDVVMRNQLQRFIRKFRERNDYPLSNQKFDRVFRILKKHQATSPFVPKSLPLESFAELRKGITCKACGSFETQSKYKSIKCRSCLTTEHKHEAALRTAYQLRYMYYDHPEMLTRRNIYEFCGKLISERTISRALTSRYKIIGATSSLYYDIQI